MNLSIAPGDRYLVDLGRLVPVVAVSPRDAFSMAVTSTFGNEVQVPLERPQVYQFGPAGELLAVYQ